MRSIIRLFLILPLALAVACNTPTNGTGNDGTPVTDPTTATDMGNSDGTAIQGRNYTVTTLDTTIKSPRKELRGTVDGVDVTINYGSPSVNNRSIYGELVPFGQVWRTGANEATRITFAQDVLVGEEETTLPAGTYALFTLPQDRDNWTIIFNRTAEQWGAYDYDEAQDAVRVSGEAEQTGSRAEMMDFAVDDDDIMLMWDDLQVSFEVEAAAK